MTKQKFNLKAFAERYYEIPHRILPPFDWGQYARPLKKAWLLLGEAEALRRWQTFCSWSHYLHAAFFLKNIEDWK